MNSIIIKGQWDKAAGRLRQEFSTLTMNEILYQKSKTNQLIERLKLKLKKARKRIIKIITDF
ncbi:MAG: hypothetical protein Q8Q47_07250 [Ignavibacteriaceae bacterium]|nr:hypothetical protein [Ignavibacteriaceae bacterium]